MTQEMINKIATTCKNVGVYRAYENTYTWDPSLTSPYVWIYYVDKGLIRRYSNDGIWGGPGDYFKVTEEV